MATFLRFLLPGRKGVASKFPVFMSGIFTKNSIPDDKNVLIKKKYQRLRQSGIWFAEDCRVGTFSRASLVNASTALDSI